MKVKSKYKIAKRLGSAVFEKTQTAKFALAAEKKRFSTEGIRSRSNYGTQLLEKQKVRFTYGIPNKQLTNYVKEIIKSKTKTPEQELFSKLEHRLDNIILRAGFAESRFQARQMVSHGHVKVNGRKNKVPSYQVKASDKIEIKESSRDKVLFINFAEKFKEVTTPSWIKVDPKTYSVTIEGEPSYKPKESHFRLGDVLQFYKR
jgi:small subunit ribosomal protein S4